MSLLFLLFAFFAALLISAAAPTPRDTTRDQWVTVEFDESSGFTAMSGDFSVPNTPDTGGMSSVWPGLQGDNGVLQAELNGQSGAWTLGNSFYGLPSLPPGSRFNVSPGETVHFSFVRIEDTGVWMCTLSGPQTAQQTLKFSLPAHTMNRAILAINLMGVPHDFTVAYSNVIITAASGSAAEWCSTSASNGYGTGAEGYIVKDAVAEGSSCHIGQIILPGTT